MCSYVRHTELLREIGEISVAAMHYCSTALVLVPLELDDVRPPSHRGLLEDVQIELVPAQSPEEVGGAATSDSGPYDGNPTPSGGEWLMAVSSLRFRRQTFHTRNCSHAAGQCRCSPDRLVPPPHRHTTAEPRILMRINLLLCAHALNHMQRAHFLSDRSINEAILSALKPVYNRVQVVEKSRCSVPRSCWWLLQCSSPQPCFLVCRLNVRVS